MSGGSAQTATTAQLWSEEVGHWWGRRIGERCFSRAGKEKEGDGWVGDERRGGATAEYSLACGQLWMGKKNNEPTHRARSLPLIPPPSPATSWRRERKKRTNQDAPWSTNQVKFEDRISSSAFSEFPLRRTLGQALWLGFRASGGMCCPCRGGRGDVDGGRWCETEGRVNGFSPQLPSAH